MCKFIKELVERDFSGAEAFDLRNSSYRQFEPIRINSNLWLSIQASYAHYSTPRQTIKDLESYTHWEMALFTKDNFITASDVLPEFLSLAELELYSKGTGYPYVPKDLVEEVYLALK